MDNRTLLLVLMVVLIVFVVLLAVLSIVFIIALRKRRPVIKVIMPSQTPRDESVAKSEPTPAPAVAESSTPTVAQSADVTPAAVEDSDASTELDIEPEADDDEDDDEVPQYVTEGMERVRYNRSLTSKLAQLNNKAKEWYSQIKNELLSYEKVKVRMSWKRETFRIGRMAVAKIVVRGKTLCVMFAVEPASYDGTKFSVRDVSNVASMSDTPTMYRIRKERRCKYAKEMIADIMKELKVYKDPHYEAQDFYIPYEGDMSLMQRGLVKRVVTGTTRTFKIEEVDPDEIDEAAAVGDNDGEA